MAKILLLGNGINLIFNKGMKSTSILKIIKERIGNWRLEENAVVPDYQEQDSWETMIETLFNDIIGEKLDVDNYKKKLKDEVMRVIKMQALDYPSHLYGMQTAEWENAIYDINNFFYYKSSEYSSEYKWSYQPDVLTLNYECFFSDLLSRNYNALCSNMNDKLKFCYVHGNFNSRWALFNDEKQAIVDESLSKLIKKYENYNNNTLNIIGVKITNDVTTINTILERFKIKTINYYWFNDTDLKNIGNFKHDVNLNTYDVKETLWKISKPSINND